MQHINSNLNFLQQVLIHRDEDFLIVNKPAGLLSVPGKGIELADCLIARLKAELPETLLIHRLDRDTSGVMLFALNSDAQRHLSKQFELRQTHKQYVALVMGELLGSGTIDMPVRYEPNTPPLHVIDAKHPKNALTRWQALETFEINNQAVTRVRLTPITGRSHQLRVHMQYIGHAIVADDLYADELEKSLSSRLCLHAESLSFIHPQTGEIVQYTTLSDF